MREATEQAKALVKLASRLEALASLVMHDAAVNLQPFAIGADILRALDGCAPLLLSPDGCPLAWDEETRIVIARKPSSSRETR